MGALLKPFHAVLTADIHLKDDSPEDLRLGIQELDDLALTAAKRGIRFVLVAGDFIDHRHRFSQNLIIKVYKTLEKHWNSGICFVILRGNHDCADHTRPEETVLSLFSKVAVIVTSPMLVVEADAIILLLPWYPEEAYRALLKTFSSYALGYPGKKRILITHVSIQEGKVSASNTRVTTPIRAKDLLPEIWDKVYSGDYHSSQDVTAWLKYLGSPRPRTFGDFDCLGAWVVCAGGEELVPLPSRYPTFNSYRVDSLADLPLVGYDGRDRNRCYVANHLREHVRQLYPGCALLPLEESAPQRDVGRMVGVDRMDVGEVSQRWLQAKKLGKEYATELKRLLGV